MLKLLLLYIAIIHAEINQLVSTEGSDQLQGYLKVDGVKNIYEACLKTEEKIGPCIWSKLNDKQKAAINELSANKSSTNRSIASEKDKKSADEMGSFIAKKPSMVINYGSDPRVKALEEVIQKKIDTYLIGTDEEQKKQKSKTDQIDHAQYLEIYQTELGKAAVQATLSYTLEASEDKCEIPENEAERKANVETKLKNISTQNLSLELSSQKTYCIGLINDKCIHGTIGTATNKKACEVVNFIKGVRKNILETQKQLAELKKLKGNIYIPEESNTIDRKKNNIDSVTTLSSQEVKDSYEKAGELLKKEMDKCVDDNGNMKSPEECKKYISTNGKKIKDQMAETAIGLEAQNEQLKEKLKTKKGVEDFLLAEGITKEEIDSKLSTDDKLAKMRKEIDDRFLAEKNAIIETMQNKANQLTTKTEGSVTKEDVPSLVAIKKEMQSRSPNELAEMIRFSNITSSYLGIEITSDKKTKDPEKSRLVAGLNLEIDTANTPEAKSLKQSVEKAKIDLNSKHDGNLDPLKFINGIFDYFRSSDTTSK